MLETPTETPLPTYRKDYRPPDHRVDGVDLDVRIGDEETLVRATLQVRRDTAADPSAPLVLQGEDMDLRAISVGGQPLAVGELEVTDGLLTVPGVPDRFELVTEVAIRPQENTKLSGLYASSGNLCTQCEAEGFRRITYFPDRPDVMARYTTRIEADAGRYPVLLSNGNRVAQGTLANGRHWVKWEDPFPKPSYLFALVAGNLVCHRGEFRTRSGRDIPLEIWVEPQNADKCEHALRSLRRAMKWDEDVFGLELDLDLYMIFVADDFNMGAMENKGLNIFNSKFVLARPDTATDDDYEGIEGVIAHEYFHNWTGNRVTCRDWFQLTLKEGLTVFRDQQFSADMTSAAVKRIQDVRLLRTLQFAEDAGPMAHPIRPESYIEMNNFYTLTVYEKGAEVVRLYHTLLGQEGFRKGMDLYFERHDGQAVTCDDFRAAMADANGVELAQLERWYLQAGTPTVRVEGRHDPVARTYELTLTQSSPEVEGAAAPQPLPIPVRVGLLDASGEDLPLRREDGDGRPELLLLTGERQSFTFQDVAAPPVPSLLRGCSAPVKLVTERSREELAFLMAHDSDSFNRWDAGQELAKELLLGLVADHAAGRELALDHHFVSAFREVLVDPQLDGSLRSLALTLPAESFLAQELDEVDPDAIHAARRFVVRGLARELRSDLQEVHDALAPTGPYANDKASIDRRRTCNLALAYLTTLEEPETTALAVRRFDEADNMTDYEVAFACLVELPGPERDRAVAAFHERWKHEPLVLDKWFRTQAMASAPDTLDRVVELAGHPDFTLRNPNRARSLLSALGANQVHFHAKDGRGYAFLADRVLELDSLNPQVTARVVSAFNQWKRFDAGRRERMKAELERIASHPGLSRDVTEIVGRALAR
jgi:aminopeptidase N